MQGGDIYRAKWNFIRQTLLLIPDKIQSFFLHFEFPTEGHNLKENPENLQLIEF